MNEESPQSQLKGFVTEEGSEKVEYSFSRKTAIFDDRSRRREGYTFGGLEADKIRASDATKLGLDRQPDDPLGQKEQEEIQELAQEASFDDMPSLHHLESTSEFGIYKLIQTKKTEFDSSPPLLPS